MAGDLDDTVIAAPRSVQQPRDAQAHDIERTVVVVPPAYSGPTGREPADISHESASNISGFFRVRVGERTVPIDLDLPCYFGRRPSSPRVSRGATPRLVWVPSPLKVVSATHLEVRQLGASVIVTDLGSTNGSVVIVPGTVPRKLRQGESVVVSPGTLVDIGDGTILQILPERGRQ